MMLLGRLRFEISERNLSQSHLIQHKSHVDWSWIEPGPPQWEAGDQVPEPKASYEEDCGYM